MTQRRSTFGEVTDRLKQAFAGGTVNRRVSRDDDLNRINQLMGPVMTVALLAAIGVGWRANAVGPVMLWVFASLGSGAAAGFLFGIPKSGLTTKAEPISADRVVTAGNTGSSPVVSTATKAETSVGARPNTNLEEVSDWLTKIIVGLTLVNLEPIKLEFQRICLNAAAAIRATPSAADVSTATALVSGFALLGFLAMYLYMRLFVQGAFVRSDANLLTKYREAVREAEIATASDPAEVPADGAPAEPVVPSAASLSAAQAVANAAPADPNLVLQPLWKLAAEYETLRIQKGYSWERTRDMAEIVRLMRPHAIAAAPYIIDLMHSTSTGEHLAATVILQMKYMPVHMEWLARRLVEERAFIGYQAASALLARMRVAGLPECKAIVDVVQSAKDERQRIGSVEPSLDKLIDQILGPQ
ncbi:hypothetical protein [Chromobacterium subtsugae]|uniref:hypothetical protein n=1 Tax=Chromobacterium subtsugae TaxID=251747 RepID=UPI0006410BBD|nr:hypothetical protein [Chromobacterium subtsugae]